jgi:hypothetical protein
MNTTNRLKTVILNTPKGLNFSVTSRRIVDTLARFRHLCIEKQSTITLRNAAYEKMAAVKKGVANGDREAPTLNKNIKRIIWEGIGGAYLAETTTGKEVVAAPQSQVDSVKWFLNGEQIEKEKIEEFLTGRDREKVDLQEKREVARGKAQELFVFIDTSNILAVNGA